MPVEPPKFSDVFAGHSDGKSMSEYAHKVWAEGLADLEERGLADKMRLHTLDRYVRFRTEFHFLYPIAMHEGPTLKGKKGGDYANMKWSMVMRLDDKIEKLERNLLISPQSNGDEIQRKSVNRLPDKAGKYLNRAANAS